MEKKRDGRRDVVMTDVEALVPKDHLLRKVEKVMDYDWLYERLSPYYCEDNGRPGIDPVVLIKMALLEHLCGLPSLRQTHRDIEVNVAYRWFLGYNLLEKIPHFATVSYAFCRRFPLELSEEIFTHILNKALNNKAVEPSMVFIDGTHLKASANKKKFQKEQVAKTAKVYARQLLEEVNEEREKLGKPPIEEADEDDGPSGGGTVEKTVSTTDPDCGMFVKGSHERQFAYEAHTACDKNGYVLGVEVTAGNIHDSVAWDALYDQVTARFPQSEYITMDAAYKTPWIVKKILDDGKIPLVPYTRYKGRKDVYKPWEFTYDEGQDCFICPQGCRLRHTTTSKDGKRFYRSTPKDCRNCPCREACGANAKGQRVLTTHIWQEYLDLAEQLRKSERGQEIYALRKETIERVFADAKDKHGMRFTHRRGLARVSSWVRLKFAAMNLKKLALWGACHSFLYRLSLAIFPFFLPFPWINRGFFDRQNSYLSRLSALCQSGAHAGQPDDFLGPLVSAASQFLRVPDVLYAIFTQGNQLTGKRSICQYAQREYAVYLPECFSVFREHDLHFTVQAVHVPHTVLHELVSQRTQNAQFCVHIFRQIRHAIVPVLYQLRNQLRVFGIVLGLTVVCQLFRLFHRIRIHLHNTDPFRYHPRSQRKPVMSCRLNAQHNLVLAMLGCQAQRPVFRALETLSTVLERIRSLAQLSPLGIDCSCIMPFAADVASHDEHVIPDEGQFVVMGELAPSLQIPPSVGLQSLGYLLCLLLQPCFLLRTQCFHFLLFLLAAVSPHPSSAISSLLFPAV